MDDLSSRKRPQMRDFVESAGAPGLYLPSYNPDLNPIAGVGKAQAANAAHDDWWEWRTSS